MRFFFRALSLAVTLAVGAVTGYAQTGDNETVTLHVKFAPGKTSLSGRRITGTQFDIPAIDNITQSHQVQSIRRIFPEAGKHEAAHRAFGLDRWYEIKFPRGPGMRGLLQDLRGLAYFEKVEECQSYSLIGGDAFEEPSSMPASPNDPLFRQQWSLDNTGQIGGTVGADIRILDAWPIESGSTEVIVAVIDAGIDVNHIDLKPALWKNPGEIPNNNVDDDNNGYIDDYHGYGFGDNTGRIDPHPHGTHVAGIIGAVSNNANGMSGIAGGSGPNNGVRLMSLAAFGSFNDGGFEAAMVYAADHGAVISQNSWGGGSTAIEDAIDYFIARAGMDNTDIFNLNVQTGPMAGGVVVFASGNNNGAVSYPATYPRVLAVASTDRNDRKSSFSNYGSHIDISAPGSNILSSVPSAYGHYVFASGTSMACPHVSGVAALVVSRYKRIGLTPNFVETRLLASADPIDQLNPAYVNWLGAGRLNAAKALEEPDNIPPAAITDLTVAKVLHDSLVLEWTATGASNYEGKAYRYDLRYSSSPINDANFLQATPVPVQPLPLVSGQRVTYQFPNPVIHETYYFAIKSSDRYVNISPLSNVISVRIPGPPVAEFSPSILAQTIGAGDTTIRYVQVTNTGEGELVIKNYVDTFTGTPGPGPRAKDPANTGKLFAINTARSTIDQLNTQNGNVIRSIPLPEPTVGTVEGLAFDGQYLYYSPGVNRKIYKMDALSGVVVKSITLGGFGSIDGLGFSGNFLYVHYADAPNFLEVNFETGQTIRSIPIPIRGFNSGYSFAGRRGTVFGTEGQGIYEFNITDGSVVAGFNGNVSNGLAYSDSENVIYAHNNGLITVYDADTKAQLRSFFCANSSGLAADESQFDWLNTSARAVRIPPGQSRLVPIYTNTNGLNAGGYSATFRSVTNDPVNRTAAVLVPISVSISPTVLFSTSRIDYGDVFAGYPVDSVILVRNPGLAPLTVSQIQSSHPDFTISHSLTTLEAGTEGQITVRVNPSTSGAIAGSITIQTNDPDDGVMEVPVSGTGKLPPTLEVNPASLTVSLDEGASEVRTLQVSNNGASDLHWNANLAPGSGGLAGGRSQQLVAPKLLSEEPFTALAPSPVPLSAMAAVPETGVIYAKSATTPAFLKYDPNTNTWQTLAPATGPGGSPAFYRDNRVYIWHSESFSVYDIASDSWSALPIGISTTGVTADSRYFYFVRGNLFHRFLPDSSTFKRLDNFDQYFSYESGTLEYANGVIYAKGGNGLTGNGNTSFTRYFLLADRWEEGPEMPGRAGFGTTFDTGSRHYYAVSQTGFKRFDVLDESWSDIPVPLFTPSPAITFIGVAGISGIYFSQQNGTGFGRYATPPAPLWFSTDINAGTVTPGNQSTIQVTFNARGLNEGTYEGTLEVKSARPPITKAVPVTLSVRGAPDIELSRTSFDCGAVYLGIRRGNQVFIRNKGTAALVVSSVTFDQPEFYFSAGSFTIYPGQVKLAYVELEPVTPGPKSANMTMVTNDPDEGTLVMPVIGEGLVPPEIQVSSDTIRTTLYSGAKSTHPLTVTNSGGSQLALQVDGYSNWVTATPIYAELEPGDSRVVNVTVAAGSKSAGFHYGRVLFTHRADYEEQVPVKLEVIPAPQMTVANTQVAFGQRYVGFPSDTTIVVNNTGVLPLQVTQIDLGHASLQLPGGLPPTIPPGGTASLTLRLTPTDTATINAAVTFHTNDPDEPTIMLPVSASPIFPPEAGIDLPAISKVVSMGADSTVMLTLNNAGLGDLRWQARSVVFGIAQGWGTSPRGTTPGPGLFLTFITDQFYTQVRNTTNIYRSYPGNGNWQLVTSVAPPGTSNAGSTAINNKLYISYLANDTTIAVYSLSTNTWSSIPNGLGTGTATLTTDGTFLYAAGGGLFRRYDPVTTAWEDLPLPEFVMTGLGGLSFYSGYIYAHEGNGFTEFARYNLVNQTWESLRPVPAGAVIGSVIDPYRKRYYAYGARGGRNLYEYDIKTNLWNTWQLPVPVDDGGLAFSTPTSNRGVHFIQGNTGNNYYYYDANDSLTWIRLNAFSGDVSPDGTQVIGVNLNSKGKAQGIYTGLITLTSNDPNFFDVDVPVTMDVRYLGPRISASRDRTEAMTVKPWTRDDSFTIRNTGVSDLHWNLAPGLPGWLTVTPMSGTLKPDSAEVIDLHLDPFTLPFSNTPYWHDLYIQSDDRFQPSLNYFVSFLVRPNNAPALMSPFPNLTMNVEDPPKTVNVSGRFHDGEGDGMRFLASSADTTIAVVTWSDPENLVVTPVAPGSSNITVRAYDEYDAQSATSFKVTVKDVVSGLEPGAASPLLVHPNPFTHQFTVEFDNPDAGLVEVSVYNLTGSEVLNFRNEGAGAGRQTVSMDARMLPAGIFFCRVVSKGNAIGSARVIKR